MASTFSYFVGVPTNIAVIASAFILVTYSISGGIRAVAFTDVMQFITFMIVVPSIIISIWTVGDFNNIDGVGDRILDKMLSFNSISGTDYWTFFLLALVPSTSPAIFQRMIIGRTTSQVKKAHYIAGLIYWIFCLMSALIGIVLFVYNPNIEIDTVFGFLVDEFTYAGLLGVNLASILAMEMSTADSHLNTSAVMISHDLCKPFGILQNERAQLLFSRVFIFIVGVLGTVMSLYFKDLISLLLFTKNFYDPIVTMPLLMSILGFRSSPRVVLCAMFSGFVTVILWKWKVQPIVGFDSLIPAMLVNTITFFTVHYILGES